MACRKYVLTNNTSGILVFSYQECSNNMWEYDIVLEPNQVRNIWLVNGTFQAALYDNFTIVDYGVFPPVTRVQIHQHQQTLQHKLKHQVQQI
jgi:hypothetical protein